MIRMVLFPAVVHLLCINITRNLENYLVCLLWHTELLRADGAR